jgi:thymidylate synthase
MTYEEQYLEGLRTILDKGKWIDNERTGVRCLTIPRLMMEYKLDSKSAPLLSTRPSYPVSACAEIIGYIRRYEWADEFADIGSPTWFVNANETQEWLKNPNRIAKNHIGKCYGASLDEQHIKDVFNKLESGIDDRGLILNWWQPDMFESSALRPCMNEHQFTIVGNTLDITSSQRSADYMCGQPFNAAQVYFLGMLGAKLSGKEGGSALHIMKHVHIYENHLGGVEELLSREPVQLDTTFNISDWVEEYVDIAYRHDHARDYFKLEGYKGKAQEKITFDLVA